MGNMYLRNLPAPLHQRLKREAAARKQTLAIFVGGLLQDAVDARDLQAARGKLAAQIRRNDIPPPPPPQPPPQAAGKKF
jgi:hypothetical protein